MNSHRLPVRPSLLRLTGHAVSAALILSAVGVATSLASSATSLGPTNAQRSATAKLSARSLLALAPVPSGSKTIATWIAADGQELSGPMSLPAGRDQVDFTKFYLVPNAARSLAWFHDEKIDGHAHSSWGSSGGPGSGNESEVAFSFSATSVLQQRMLEYSLLPVSHNQLEVRVDALVSYVARKSIYSIIARGAVKVAVVVNRGDNAKHNRVSAYSTTNIATINELITKVNDLPPALSGVFSCPADFGASVTLRFYGADAVAPYAVVVADPGGCGSVTIRDYDALDAQAGPTTVVQTGSTQVSGGYGLGQFIATIFHIATLQAI
jgi:hypothetical protein